MSGTTEKMDESKTAQFDEQREELWTKYKHLIRPCSVYKDEYKNCKSWRERFNQYFIYGQKISCDQWAEDVNNCFHWSWMEDKEAAIRVIENELKRKTQRIKVHLDNDTWTKRDSPPADWSKPLPDFMIERNKNSYLDTRCKQMEEEEEKARQDPTYKVSNNYCRFM